MPTESLPFADQFFSTAIERYRIHTERQRGTPVGKLTTDPQFQQWRFCNVHREDDKTTVWFREHVRKHLRGLSAVNATLIFRWFNRIETGEVIKDLLLEAGDWGTWHTEEARKRLRNVKPVVTGAYIIKGWDGYTKLDGVLKCVDTALPRVAEWYPNWMDLREHGVLQLRDVFTDLCQLHYMGKFMAYEAVCDLRWTDVLENATDIHTWANAGPGAARGLGWCQQNRNDVFNYGSERDQAVMNILMTELLEASYGVWPTGWKPWEMREVEHWLCEFDKYKRAERGDSMKRKFR